MCNGNPHTPEGGGWISQSRAWREAGNFGLGGGRKVEGRVEFLLNHLISARYPVLGQGVGLWLGHAST